MRHVIVFKNHGADAGASHQHPHSAIVDIPIVPGEVVERIERARRFFADSGQCLACTLIAQERDQACRIIAENAGFVAFIPYAALSPYHLWIFPRTHEACFSGQPALSALAEVLHTVLPKVHGMLANPRSTLPSAQSVRRKGCGAFSLVHFHRAAVNKTVGFELGTGMYVNPSSPQSCAQDCGNLPASDRGLSAGRGTSLEAVFLSNLLTAPFAFTITVSEVRNFQKLVITCPETSNRPQ